MSGVPRTFYPSHTQHACRAVEMRGYRATGIPTAITRLAIERASTVTPHLTAGAPELYPDHVRICERLGLKFPGPTRQLLMAPGDVSRLRAAPLSAAGATDVARGYTISPPSTASALLVATQIMLPWASAGSSVYRPVGHPTARTTSVIQTIVVPRWHQPVRSP
jgi:hypothetical protein